MTETNLISQELKKLPSYLFGRKDLWEEVNIHWKVLRDREDALKNKPSVEVLILPSYFAGDPALRDLSLSQQSYTEVKKITPVASWDKAIETARNSQADWVLVMPADLILHPTAISHFVIRSQENPETSVWYSDEVQYQRDLKRLRLFSKKKDSPIALRHRDFLGDFVFIKREFLTQAQGSICLHDFLVNQSTQKPFGLVPYFLGYRSVEAFEKAFAPQLPEPLLLNPVSISAIICFRDKADITLKCLEALSKVHREENLEVVLVDNQSHPEQLKTVISGVEKLGLSYQCLCYSKKFNFAEMHRLAAEKAKGDVLLLLNNDVFLDASTHLGDWANWSLKEKIACVGIKLFYPNGKIQHLGIRAVRGDSTRLIRISHYPNQPYLADYTREVFGCTFAAAMVRKETFQKIGLRPWDVANGLGDVWFQLEAARQGFHNLYLSQYHAVHLESASRGLNFELWEHRLLEENLAGEALAMWREDFSFVSLSWMFPYHPLTIYFRDSLLRKFPWLRSFYHSIFNWMKRLRAQNAS